MNLVAPTGIIAVVREFNTEATADVARALLAAGVPTVEITLTSPGAVDLIAELAAEAPGRIAAGTVRTPADVRDCVAAGAAALVAPDTAEDTIREAVRLEVPFVPGALTPTEVVRAHSLGAAAVKLFPISAMGGPRYVKELSGPLPGIRFVVSGGVTADDCPAFFAAGAHAACIGGAFVDRDALARRDLEAITTYGRSVLEAATR